MLDCSTCEEARYTRENYMEETLTCKRCGGNSPTDATFCIECGAPLAEPATGPTTRLEEPRQYTNERPATAPVARPAAPIIVAQPLPPPMAQPRGNRPARGPDLTAPFVIIGLALALLFVPRFGGPAVIAIGAGGLILRSMLTRPDRVLPLLVLFVLLGLLFTGSKLFWPALFLVFVLRVMLRGRP
jgi:ribosomal protein L40E